MMDLNDARIREALLRKLARQKTPPRAVLEELHVHNGNAIADDQQPSFRGKRIGTARAGFDERSREVEGESGNAHTRPHGGAEDSPSVNLPLNQMASTAPDCPTSRSIFVVSSEFN
ncbi:hypothetical protein ACXR0O_29270 [Verrucomicrobiota bacterium sgz303538]